MMEISDNDIIIRCGSTSLRDLILSYLDECEVDIINEGKKRGIKIRYFDVDSTSNEILID